MPDELALDPRVLDRLCPRPAVTVASEDPVVLADQRRWRQVRRTVSRRRGALVKLAAGRYPRYHLAGTGALACGGWLPAAPVPLEDVTLRHIADGAPPEVDGSEPAGASTRPLATAERRYPRYSQAVGDLDPPRLFENRLSYRLLGLEFTGGRGTMEFGQTTYFDMIDVSEALVHELALEQDGLRSLVGDPFDAGRRSLLAAVDTLTLRVARDGTATFPVQRRDPAAVATGGGSAHVIPAGEFQPSSASPESLGRDFDLWHNTMREYSEELLGHPERHGGPIDGPIDYDTEEPFATMQRARRSGRVRVYCLGAGQDALSLKTGIYAVALWDAETFDEVFAGMVRRNDEGTISASAVPFTEQAVGELLDGGRLVPGAAGVLYLAWQHRDSLR